MCNGLLVVFYQDYDVCQIVVFDECIGVVKVQLKDCVYVIVGGYIDCVLLQGSEIQGILVVLVGLLELLQVKWCYQQDFIVKCVGWFGGFVFEGSVLEVGFWVILGVVELLVDVVVVGWVVQLVVEVELEYLIVVMV